MTSQPRPYRTPSSADTLLREVRSTPESLSRLGLTSVPVTPSPSLFGLPSRPQYDAPSQPQFGLLSFFNHRQSSGGSTSPAIFQGTCRVLLASPNIPIYFNKTPPNTSSRRRQHALDSPIPQSALPAVLDVG
ncbi:hypothetical protein IF1G_04816 [Cordyceps javanica]|uniref:Uncharacterized protein n=1 Tax=Cordyceps javanica TaxID=43265 RepID=A0A545W0R7_9HYPO|nr:hypothetical protein IF1G_04816 [Cordyceps javanica]TQW07536.1 hypothetical protein IF2G_04697 [Cordyceps javanica]